MPSYIEASEAAVKAMLVGGWAIDGIRLVDTPATVALQGPAGSISRSEPLACAKHADDTERVNARAWARAIAARRVLRYLGLVGHPLGLVCVRATPPHELQPVERTCQAPTGLATYCQSLDWRGYSGDKERCDGSPRACDECGRATCNGWCPPT